MRNLLHEGAQSLTEVRVMTHEQLINVYVNLFKVVHSTDQKRNPSDFKSYAPWAQRMENEFGLVRLGSGYNGAAFAPEKADDIVVKIGYGKDDGSAAYLAYCYVSRLNGRYKSWMPVVYSMYVDPIIGVYCAVVERLSKADPDMVQTYRGKIGLAPVYSEFYVRGATTPRDIDDMMEVLGRISDLHSDNAMLRGSELVMTDPYMKYNDRSVYNVYKAGPPRFIGADYEREMEVLSGARGKPSIERKQEGRLPRLQPDPRGIFNEVRRLNPSALLRMRVQENELIRANAPREVAVAGRDLRGCQCGDCRARAKYRRARERAPEAWFELGRGARDFPRKEVYLRFLGGKIQNRVRPERSMRAAANPMRDFEQFEQRIVGWIDRQLSNGVREAEKILDDTNGPVSKFKFNKPDPKLAKAANWAAIQGNKPWQRGQVPPKGFAK